MLIIIGDYYTIIFVIHKLVGSLIYPFPQISDNSLHIYICLVLPLILGNEYIYSIGKIIPQINNIVDYFAGNAGRYLVAQIKTNL